jgi:predicted ester cyclase
MGDAMGEALTAAEAFYEAFATADVAKWLPLFSDDCITVTPAGALDQAGHEALGRAFHAAFPDARMEVLRTLESGDEVYITGRFKGTHTGDLVSPAGTIPASGQPIDFGYVDYFRVVDGTIVAEEVVWDQLTFLAQIGAFPAP